MAGASFPVPHSAPVKVFISYVNKTNFVVDNQVVCNMVVLQWLIQLFVQGVALIGTSTDTPSFFSTV